jgi:hypothetical protein
MRNSDVRKFTTIKSETDLTDGFNILSAGPYACSLGHGGFFSQRGGSTFIYMGVAYIAHTIHVCKQTQGGGGVYVNPLHMDLLQTECLLLGCKQSMITP